MESLFDSVPPIPHRHWAAEDIRVTLNAWQVWKKANAGAHAEKFVTDHYLEQPEFGVPYIWPNLERFIALRLALPFTRTYRYEGTTNLSHHNILEAPHPIHKAWFAPLLGRLNNEDQITVLTTNWDICIERALRPYPTRYSPGFHYGLGQEVLTGAHVHPMNREYRANPHISGTIPLLKLHGSLSWAVQSDDVLVKYGDLRPALRQKGQKRIALVPPIEEKFIPIWLRGLWEQARTALSTASIVLVVGYSFPEYDLQIWDLFRSGLEVSNAPIHIFSKTAREKIVPRLHSKMPSLSLYSHPRLPEGIADISTIL